MAFGSIKIKLRPLRLAFLVEPSDRAAIVTAIETSSFLWGGAFNPIIPVYQKLPKFWGRDSKRGITAQTVVEGYLDAFDPDYVVKVGKLESEDLKFGHREIVKCSDIISPVEKDGTPKYGIGLSELLHDFYEKELKFVQVEPLTMRLPQIGLKHRLFLTSVFGAFPAKIQKQFQTGWAQRFASLEFKKCSILNYAHFLTPENLFLRRLGTMHIQPLRVRSFGSRNCIFLLNANSNLDILDYWNLRAIGWNVMPVCRQMANDIKLLENASKYVEENSFADRNNPNFFNDTILLKGRTVSIGDLDKFARSLKLTPPKHPHDTKIVLHPLYPRIWDEWARERDNAEPCELHVADEEHDITAESKSVTFSNLMPEFASRYGGHSTPRCANEIELRIWNSDTLPAEIVPEGDWHLASAAGASGFDRWRCAKSGLVHLPEHKNRRERLALSSAETVFSAWLKTRGWDIELSNSGHIARQMLKHLKGAFGIGLLAKPGVIELFDKLAVGHTRRKNDEEFSDNNQNDLATQEPGRTLSHDKFRGMIAKIANESKYKESDPDRLIKSFIEYRMVQLGLKLQCQKCRQNSWYSVKEADYELRCPQCLEQFKFPEQSPKEITWAYRAIGPFSLPQQAFGAYSVVLTLYFFARLLDGATTPMLSFTAKKGTCSIEADLGLFFQRSKYAPSHTELIFAECKTFGHFKKSDADRMVTLATEFPGSILVFATLRTSLTKAEKRLLRPVVNLGRKYWKAERPINPVLILTGNELLAEDEPRQVWKEMGGIHAAHVRSLGDWSDLVSLADETQQIYLDLKPWHESVRARQNTGRRKEVLTPQTQVSVAEAPMAAPFPVAMRQVPWK